MSRLHSIYQRARGFFTKKTQDAEMAEEMRMHLDALIERNLAQGMTPEEARHAARRLFGGEEQIKENCRDQRRLVWLEQLAKDFTLALRGLRRSPGFTTAAVLTLALGLSVNIAVFNIISGIFFKPLRVQDPDSLVLLLKRSPAWPMPHGLSWADYKDYKKNMGDCSDMLALLFTPAHLSASGKQPERTYVEAVSGNYFSMLGIQPAQGRFFLPEEGQKPGADPVVVLSHRCWQTQFGGDPAIVGKPVVVNGTSFTVIGVAPATFNSAQWALAPSAFIPATMVGQFVTNGGSMLDERGMETFKVMGRLKPGITSKQATASMSGVTRQLASLHPWENEKTSSLVLPEKSCRPEASFSDFMPFAAAVFMAMMGLVLLIACANVTNLMFSRSLVRQREIGIRSAIGASRGQLLRQLLVESVILALIAGVLGYALANVCGRLITANSPPQEMPVMIDESWDWRVGAFTVFASLAAGLVVGIVPALRATKLDVVSLLKGSSDTALSSGRHPFRNMLVVSQVTICLVVIICSGLFVQSLRQLSSADLGFHSKNLVLASFDLGLQRYSKDRGEIFQRQLVEKIHALPGVQSASLATAVPFDTSMMMISFAGAEERTTQGTGQDNDGYITTAHNCVDESYLRTSGAVLMKGRDFTSKDDPTSPLVAIINQNMARQLWPDKDALGKRFRFNKGGPLLEVVGVVRDGRYKWLSERPQPFFYVPLAQHYSGAVTLHVRSAVDPEALITTLRSTVHSLDKDLPIYNVRTMEAHLEMSPFAFLPLRFGAGLAAVQGALGLFLAVLGIYGVIAFVVSQRTREIGIRVALGAQGKDVLWMVTREGLKLVLIGLGIGLLIAFGFVRLLSVLLYGFNPMSLPVFAAAVALLVGVAVLACYLPARRATQVNPVDALRSE